jgi:hypothetical protein
VDQSGAVNGAAEAFEKQLQYLGLRYVKARATQFRYK